MRFCNPADGAAVDEADTDTHEFMWLAAEDGDRYELMMSMQPHAGWESVQGTMCIAYTDAMLWATNCGVVATTGLALALDRRGLLTATAITRALRVMVAAVVAHDAALALGRSPKGAFLARTARAVAKTSAASLAECTFAAADWVSLAAPTTAYSGTAQWIPSLQLGMLAENGTCSARRVGWLMYAAQGHGPPDASGDGGPLHLVLKRVKGQLVDAQVGDDLEDVAVAAAGVICGREMPRQLAVYRPAGPLRRAAAMAELDSTRPREEVEEALFQLRAHEVIACWQVRVSLTKTQHTEGCTRVGGDWACYMPDLPGLNVQHPRATLHAHAHAVLTQVVLSRVTTTQAVLTHGRPLRVLPGAR